MSKVRIGFVGVGSMGQCAHLKNYVTLPECEVVAIAEIRQELGRRVAERYGIPKVYPNHKAMLSAEKLDGIVASQPFTRHATLVPELLRAGVPVFIEKPLARSLENGEKILEALARSGTWLMVGYHKRSDLATMYVKAEIARLKSSGELGRLKYVRILMAAGDWVSGGFADLITTDEPVPPLPTDPPASDLDAQTDEQYVNFVNFYIHQVNLLRYLLGESYEVTYADPSGVLLVARSEGGAAASIEMSPYVTSQEWHESALVCFEHGYLKLDLPAPLASGRAGRVEILRDPGKDAGPEVKVPVFPPVHAMRQQAMNFLVAIQGKAKPPCEAAEALEDLKVARQYIRLWKGC